MAFTSTKTTDGIAGNLRFQIYDIDFDSVTAGKVSTGLSNVLIAIYVPKTSDKHAITNPNTSDGSTASYGDVYLSDVSSNDEGKLIVFGA